jgi:hypothetical protein
MKKNLKLNFKINNNLINTSFKNAVERLIKFVNRIDFTILKNTSFKIEKAPQQFYLKDAGKQNRTSAI